VSDATVPSHRSVRERWGWVVLIGGLVVAGVLLALADIAVGNRFPSPMASLVVAPEGIATPTSHRTQTLGFDRNRLTRFTLTPPIRGIGPLSPFAALRALLSNGAGLVLLALGALILFPSRVRGAVERLEGSRAAPALALAAGIAVALLTLAAITLLRFTLLFLAVIPVVLLVALVAALFGMGCIALAIGRLLRRSLRLPEIHPLLAGLTGALAVFDLAVIPYAGVFALGLVAVAGLGLTVVTRFGSVGEWSFGDLTW